MFRDELKETLLSIDEKRLLRLPQKEAMVRWFAPTSTIARSTADEPNI